MATFIELTLERGTKMRVNMDLCISYTYSNFINSHSRLIFGDDHFYDVLESVPTIDGLIKETRS